MRRRFGIVAAVIGLVAVGLAAVMALRPSPRPAPNVLIILWDTVRADRMSMYGYELPTTPRMDAWAARDGVVYDNALSPAMWTVPSHASLFTGLAPTTHGAGTEHRWLDDHNLTLAEHFAAHGYDTYAFSANPNLSPNRVNLVQGFEHIDLSWGRRWRRQVVQHARRKLMRRDGSTEISPGNPAFDRNPGFYNAGPITREAFLAFLDAKQAHDDERPFFAYLSYMEAHKPRIPLLAHRRVVADDDTIQRGLDTDLTFMNQLLYSYGLTSYTEAELEAVNRVYDATLLDLDEATADLLDDLEARGVLDNTIVVFTSDHGEQLGTHQQFGHRNGVYQQLLHVPLVIAYPPQLSPGRVATRVSNLELFSTMVQLAGLPQPDGPQFRGNLARMRDRVAQTLFAESISVDKLGFGKVKQRHPELGRDMWANLYRTVVSGEDDHKLIETVDYDSGEIVRRELYDLGVDPLETRDLAAAEPARVEALSAELAAFRAALPPWRPDEADLQKARDADEHMTREACEQLEKLGYVQGDCADFD